MILCREAETVAVHSLFSTLTLEPGCQDGAFSTEMNRMPTSAAEYVPQRILLYHPIDCEGLIRNEASYQPLIFHAKYPTRAFC